MAEKPPTKYEPSLIKARRYVKIRTLLGAEKEEYVEGVDIRYSRELVVARELKAYMDSLLDCRYLHRHDTLKIDPEKKMRSGTIQYTCDKYPGKGIWRKYRCPGCKMYESKTKQKRMSRWTRPEPDLEMFFKESPAEAGE